MYRMEVHEHFDAAHFLPGFIGKCANMHGHRWEVVVSYVFDDVDLHPNVLLDFGLVKQVIRDLDHSVLNETLEYPSAENIAHYLWCHMPAPLMLDCYIVVEVWESPGCMVSYEGPRSASFDGVQGHETPDLPGEVYEQ